jgi:proteasome lid subunit RPN8/RPN11
VWPSKPPAGKKLVGVYHTHGRYGNAGLSGPDKQLADNQKIPYYVGTPIGTIVKYDPHVGLPQIIIGQTRVPR